MGFLFVLKEQRLRKYRVLLVCLAGPEESLVYGTKDIDGAGAGARAGPGVGTGQLHAYGSGNAKGRVRIDEEEDVAAASHCFVCFLSCWQCFRLRQTRYVRLIRVYRMRIRIYLYQEGAAGVRAGAGRVGV